MRVFCVLVPGGGGPPARRPRRELPARRPRRELPARRPRRELPARRPRRELRSARRLEARAASCPLAVRRAASCPFGVRAVSCPLAVRGARVLFLVCVLAPGGGGPPARRPRRELRSARRLEARAANRLLGAPARRPRRELPACRLRSLCSLACLRVGAWGRRPARSPSAPRASLGASSRSPARPCRRPQAPEPTQVHGFSPCPGLGGSCVGENPQLSRTHRPATAS